MLLGRNQIRIEEEERLLRQLTTKADLDGRDLFSEPPLAASRLCWLLFDTTELAIKREQKGSPVV